MSREIKRIQDLMRRDPGIDGDAQRIGQLSWLLLLASLGRLKTPVSQMAVAQWAYLVDAANGNGNVLDLVASRVFPSLRADQEGGGWIAAAFSDVALAFTSGAVLGEVVLTLDNLLDRSSSDRFVVSDIYEKILGDLRSAGNAGEFYTPRAIVDLIAATVGIRDGDEVYDPACGTAGFLVAAANFATSAGLSISLSGTEKKALPHLLGMTNLLLHTGEAPEGLKRENSLAVDSLLRSQKHDVIITNPPFGGEEEAGVEATFPTNLRTRSTADLFVSAIIDGLRPGGRAAIVLPDGFLYSEGVSGRIRARLFEEGCVSRMVRLPEGVFSPYTGIRTNILYFEKSAPATDLKVLSHKGPPDAKRYTRTRPITSSDVAAIRDWSAGRVSPPGAFTVPLSELKKTAFKLDVRERGQEGAAVDVPVLRASWQACSTEVVSARAKLISVLSDNRFGSGPMLTRALVALELADRKVQLDKAWQLVLAAGFLEGTWENGGTGSAPPPITGELTEIPTLEVPKHFSWRRLDAVGRVVGGATPPADDPSNFQDDGIPWLTPADLNGLTGRYIQKGKRSLSKKGFDSCSVELLPVGTVLFSSRAPIGYCAIAGVPLATNQGFKSVVPGESVSSEYLYHYLQFARPMIERMASGTTFKEISGGKMRGVPVLVPRPEIQREIALALSEAETAFAGLRTLLAEQDRVRSQIVDACFDAMISHY